MRQQHIKCWVCLFTNWLDTTLVLMNPCRSVPLAAGAIFLQPVSAGNAGGAMCLKMQPLLSRVSFLFTSIAGVPVC